MLQIQKFKVKFNNFLNSMNRSSKLPVSNAELKYDHEGIPLDDPRMKGLSRFFSNSTIRGRANVAKATFGAFFAFYLYKKFQKAPEKTEKENVFIVKTEGKLT